MKVHRNVVSLIQTCILCFIQDLPKARQPQFVLDVETDELFINAGLQDRVIQVCLLCYYTLLTLKYGVNLLSAPVSSVLRQNLRMILTATGSM